MDLVGTRSHTLMPETQAYMAPEAELGPSCNYTEKVDIFSFEVLIIHTLTHQLPVPGPTRAKVNGRIIAVGEYERRKHYLRVCSDAEVEAFQTPIQRCLELDPDDRITSTSLVQDFQLIQEVVGVPTMGNILEDAPQSKDGSKLRDKLLLTELRAKEERRLMQEKVVDLESKIQELQRKLDEVVNQAKVMERARDTQFYPHCVVYVYGGGGGAGWQRVGGQPRVWYMYVASRLYGSETIVCTHYIIVCICAIWE